MDGEQLAERLGQMSESIKHIREDLAEVKQTLSEHASREEARIKHIEQQLSLGRFLFLTAKAIVLTAIALLAFKFGDIGTLWAKVIK